MAWNDAAIARLRQLWSEGLSTVQIARRMGISKNAVVGKAHRLGLVARPSPIVAAGTKLGPRRVPRAGVVTLPPLTAQTLALPATFRTIGGRESPLSRGRNRTAIVGATLQRPASASEEPAAAPTRFLPRAGLACCWPIGEPRTPGFRFCGVVAPAGKPYCAEHAAVAYAGRAAAISVPCER